MPHSRTASGSYTASYITGTRIVRHARKYYWPVWQFNLWVILMLISACAILGILGNFVSINDQMRLYIPWYFPYFMTVAALTICYVLILIFLTWKGRLLPAIVMIGAVMFFIMWMVGLVRISITLWGQGQVNSQCSLSVWSADPHGENVVTLAWLMQRTICQSWQALFSFSLVGTALFIWIMIMSYRVFADL